MGGAGKSIAHFKMNGACCLITPAILMLGEPANPVRVLTLIET